MVFSVDCLQECHELHASDLLLRVKKSHLDHRGLYVGQAEGCQVPFEEYVEILFSDIHYVRY